MYSLVSVKQVESCFYRLSGVVKGEYVWTIAVLVRTSGCAIKIPLSGLTFELRLTDGTKLRVSLPLALLVEYLRFQLQL